MADSLATYLNEEFPVIPAELRVLRLLAYEAVAEYQRTLDARATALDLEDEDVITRLQEPRAFGLFARRVLDSRVSREVKIAVAERTFDLIPLPASEFSAFPAAERTPAGLLRFARFLLENEAFTVLHLLHLVYAAFLDLSVVRAADRTTRGWVLMSVVAREELPEVMRLLLAFQFLAAMPPRDASASLAAILRVRSIRSGTKTSLAAIASASDGGRSWFAATAVQEGLLPPPLESEASAIEHEARVPAIPDAARTRARTWLARTAETGSLSR